MMNQEKTSFNNEGRGENLLFGIVGAFLFSLIGGALYFVLYQIGYVAAISGLIGVICAIKGYSIFAKKESVRGIILAVVVAAFVLVIAWYFCLANDVYLAYQDWYENGEVEYSLTFFESVRVAYLFLEDAPGYFGDLAISLLLAAVGCGSYVARTIKKAKAAKDSVESKDAESDPY